MRIGVDCRLWNETGVGRYIRNLVWELEKIDRNNDYILFFRENEYQNVQIDAVNFKKRLAHIRWHSIKEQFFLPGIFYKEKLDLLHFPYFSAPIFYTKPFIITIHDLIINHFPTGKASTRNFLFYWLKLWAYKIILFFAIRRAEKVIAVSEATKSEIVQHYKRKSEDIVVTLEGVDERISNIPAKSRGARSIKERYFLYVGNAYPHKNLERLLEAFISFSFNNVKLIFVGRQDFFYIRLKQRVRELNLAERTAFYEKVSDAGLANLYNNAIALVTPSIMEGFGLPVLEAMANGCPVVCSEIDAFKEVCADAALYFDPQNVDDIRGKLEYILRNPDLCKQLIEKGIERAKLFSWRKMAEKTLKVYSSIAC